MALKFLQSLDADDIFISYSRRDGAAYLTGLDAALSARGFSCFTDKRGTDAGRLPPETLYRKVKACKTLVLLASPGALERPENITPELKEFAEANGTSRIVCLSFDRDTEFAEFPETWMPFVVGKAHEREDLETLKTGKPSETIINNVAAASDYMKSKDRLRKYRNRALYVLAFLVVAIAVAAVLAGVMFRRAAAATVKAAAETERAASATREAQAALSQAQDAQAQARDAQAQANAARDEATNRKASPTKQQRPRRRRRKSPTRPRFARKRRRSAPPPSRHAPSASSNARSTSRPSPKSARARTARRHTCASDPMTWAAVSPTPWTP
jgi:type II secretory pathway pseudopilin PulG